MLYFRLVYLRVILLVTTACSASASNHHTIDAISDDELVFVPFEPLVPCGDGSPAGMYREESLLESSSTTASKKNNTNHIIVFLDGNACTTETNCVEKLNTSPYRLSSELWPQSIKGNTILSRNATENPVASNFTRWIVPYCSQDLFLGDGKNRGTEITRAGDVIFDTALHRWQEDVLLESEPIDTLIVAGLSAGAIAVLNHLELIQNISRAVNVEKLRVIMDSVAIASQNNNAEDLEPTMMEIVDFDKHPLCNSAYTQSFQASELWNIPCCLSIHCMLEYDPVLRNLAQNDDENWNERLLLIDSVYDPLAVSTIFSGFEFPAEDPSPSNIDTITSGLFEIGGSREQQFVQSAYGSSTRLGSNVLWAVTNAAAHRFLLPSLEIEQLRCNFNQNRSIITVCKEDGVGLRGELIYGLDITAWFTTDSWVLITVNGESIQDIIFDFVHDNPENLSHGLILDDCIGPNCVPSGATERNPAQQLIVVTDDFVSISSAAKIFLLCVIACLGFMYLLRLLPVDIKSSKVINNNFDTLGSVSDSMPDIIRIENITVKVLKTEKTVLKDISFNIVPGEITGLIGSSGAGKTTLFNLLCGQLPSGLQGFKRNEEFDTLDIQTSYLRQFGNSSLQDIELGSYLRITARLYGALESELVKTVSFLNRSFGDRIDDGPDFGGIKIKQLSGGQQRMVAILVTLLTRPKLLLLDEPLSGLDSVNSLLVMQFLRDLIKEQSCSVILTIHQPSDMILEKMDNVLVLQRGSLTVNENIENFVKKEKRVSVFLHETLDSDEKKESSSILTFIQKPISIATSSVRSKTESLRMSIHFATSTVRSKTESLRQLHRCLTGFDLWQIKPLMRRMHLENGPNIWKFVELPLCYLLFCLLLRFDNSPVQFVLTSLLFCAAPVFVFQTLLLEACTIYDAHKLELEDGRISPTSFFLASFLCLFSVPVIAIAVATAIGYAVLGWNFGTYIDQYLFACMYTMVCLQLGRSLAIYYNGNYRKMEQIYVLYACFSIVMSGALISPNKLPSYLSWLTYLSFGFWSVAGINLIHFDRGDLFNDGTPCSSLNFCILQEGALLGRFFGYTPIATTRLSYQVLMGSFTLLFLVEYVLMCNKYGTKYKKVRGAQL